LWRSVTSGFELDPHEGATLGAACVIADLLARLSAELASAPSVLADDGALAREYRLQALALGRLLAALRLPVEDTGAGRPQRRAGQRGFYVVGA
jgi:hypothetical protein